MSDVRPLYFQTLLDWIEYSETPVVNLAREPRLFNLLS